MMRSGVSGKQGLYDKRKGYPVMISTRLHRWLNKLQRKIDKWFSKILCLVSPTLYSRYLFLKIKKQRLHLKKPRNMDEKIMWLKLNTYRDNPLVTKCADKYLVREYIKECGFEGILNELYYVWNKPEEIKWEDLPDSFVIKCNHGCGFNLLCPDKATMDKDAVLRQIRLWYNDEFWQLLAELQYKKIPKKIICEKYLGDDLPDYKIYCFNGVPLYILVCVGRYSNTSNGTLNKNKPKFLFFDTEWKLCPLNRDSQNCTPDEIVAKPEGFEEMLAIAEKLSQPFPFVRVDLYNQNGRIYFGELTFTPAAALDKDRLPETDLFFGELIDLHYTDPMREK